MSSISTGSIPCRKLPKISSEPSKRLTPREGLSLSFGEKLLAFTVLHQQGIFLKALQEIDRFLTGSKQNENDFLPFCRVR